MSSILKLDINDIELTKTFHQLFYKKGYTMGFSRIGFTGMILVNLAIASSSMALTTEQQKELYEKGTITVLGENGNVRGHYIVNFMPGAHNVIRASKEALESAAAAIDDVIDRKGFWHDQVYSSFKKGTLMMRKSVHYGCESVRAGYLDTLRMNKKMKGDFGETAGKAANWIQFGIGTLGQMIMAAAGTAFGGGYSLLVPCGHIVSRPLEAALLSLNATAVQSLRFTWNMAAWYLVKGNNEPKNDDFTVYFVKASDSQART